MDTRRQESSQTPTLFEAWAAFLRRVVLARHYHQIYLMVGTRTIRNPIVDLLLVRALYVEAFEIKQRYTKMARKLSHQPAIKRAARRSRQSIGASISVTHGFDRIRILRNEIAHNPRVEVSWKELDYAVNWIDDWVRSLPDAPKRPELKFHWERSELVEVLGPPRYYTRDFKWWVTENGRESDSWSFTENLWPVGYSPPTTDAGVPGPSPGA